MQFTIKLNNITVNKYGEKWIKVIHKLQSTGHLTMSRYYTSWCYLFKRKSDILTLYSLCYFLPILFLFFFKFTENFLILDVCYQPEIRTRRKSGHTSWRFNSHLWAPENNLHTTFDRNKNMLTRIMYLDELKIRTITVSTTSLKSMLFFWIGVFNWLKYSDNL